MNFYDEEITLNADENNLPYNVKVERISSGRPVAKEAGTSVANRSRQKLAIRDDLTNDDDGLTQGDRDHDDEEDSDIEADIPTLDKKKPDNSRLPGNSKIMNFPTAKALDVDTEPSEAESEEGSHRLKGQDGVRKFTSDDKFSITPEKWESLPVDPEIKELFPYILKYTPQNIDISYHLQPFVPEYVPAVGDVDAFLKVIEPTHFKSERSKDVQDHLRKQGLYFLDEPSGSQSEPSLLNMKFRSALTNNSNKTRNTSAQLVPFAKSDKDIDKWINEVEQVHVHRSVHDAQPRKDIESLIIDWPRSYFEAKVTVEVAYQQCLTKGNTLLDYIHILCQQFEIDGPLEKQSDYILSLQTLFALYLAANQAWE